MRVDPRQLQPGDDHDRRGRRRRVYIEPLTVEVVARDHRSASGRTACCRRSAARPASTWPSQLAERGHPRRVRRPAARHAAGGDPARPRTASCSSDLLRRDRRAGRRERDHRHAGRGAASFASRSLPLPLVIRPAYTLGGTGGGIAHTPDELDEIVASGIDASPIHQILVERSLLGWKEVEYEVMRDGADTCITICNMENLDPMGVHTGDTIVVAPSQTLSDNEYQMLRTAALKIIRALGIEGGCNVQFALDPHSLPVLRDRGQPARQPLLRAGLQGDRLPDRPRRRQDRDRQAAGRDPERRHRQDDGRASSRRSTTASSRFRAGRSTSSPTADRTIGTQMKATGEVMAIDRSFEAALQKAVRSLESGAHGPRSGKTRPGASRTLEAIWSSSSARPTCGSGPSWPRCGAASHREKIHDAAAASIRGSSTSSRDWSRMERPAAERAARRAELLWQAKRARLLRRARSARWPAAPPSEVRDAAATLRHRARSTRWWIPAPPSSRPPRRTSTAPTRRRTRRRRSTRPQGGRHRLRPDPHRPGHRVRLLLASRPPRRSQRGGRRARS